MGQAHLLIIDPQEDFCNPSGTLYVPGAEHDMMRLAELVSEKCRAFADVHVTLDSHQDLHIAHPEFVVDAHGAHPAPFTVITAAMAKNGDFRAANPATQSYWVYYLEQLEANGRSKYNSPQQREVMDDPSIDGNMHLLTDGHRLLGERSGVISHLTLKK